MSHPDRDFYRWSRHINREGITIEAVLVFVLVIGILAGALAMALLR